MTTNIDKPKKPRPVVPPRLKKMADGQIVNMDSAESSKYRDRKLLRARIYEQEQVIKEIVDQMPDLDERLHLIERVLLSLSEYIDDDAALAQLARRTELHDALQVERAKLEAITNGNN